MLRSLLLVLLALVLAPAQDLPESVRCRTCYGKGEASLRCFYCEGDGQGPCAACTDYWWLKREVAILGVTDAEEARSLDKRVRDLDQLKITLRRIAESPIPVPAEVPAHTKERGQLRCPEFCDGGDSFLNPGHTCMVCAGAGQLECKSCKGSGQTRCFMCSGKKKLLITCPECSGGGSVIDRFPRGTDVASCPWCDDERLTDCRLCDEEGQLERGCWVCAGSGKLTCRKCIGTKKSACAKCLGTGDLSSTPRSGSSLRCGECRAKGVVRCGWCKSGRMKCGACEGKKRLEGACYSCMGHKRAPCVGCWQGSELAWVETAERLFSSERFPEAAAYMEVAIERVRARQKHRLEALIADQKQREALEAEHAQELRKLELRLARMRE